MKEDYVSYEQAVKLKELGFCEETIGKYVDCPDNPTLFQGMLYQSWNLWSDEILAPTTAMAQKWLREVGKINVRVSYIPSSQRWFADWFNLETNEYDDTDEAFSTYEEALVSGIDVALKILEEKE